MFRRTANNCSSLVLDRHQKVPIWIGRILPKGKQDRSVVLFEISGTALPHLERPDPVDGRILQKVLLTIVDIILNCPLTIDRGYLMETHASDPTFDGVFRSSTNRTHTHHEPIDTSPTHHSLERPLNEGHPPITRSKDHNTAERHTEK